MTLDQQSWGFRRNAKIEDYLTPNQLIHTLIETVTCGGHISTQYLKANSLFFQALTDFL